MPSRGELSDALNKSGHFEDYKLQASLGGSGRNYNDPTHADPRKWVPIMMSPVLGNPLGNTLQEFHYQSRCINMVGAHEVEERRGARYERVVFTRLEFDWLAAHPPLHLLDARYLWVPTGEDNTGLNDRHWVANRRDAEGVFRRWDALVAPPPGDVYRQIFFATTKVRPAFISSESFMKLHIQFHSVGVARFPNVAYLQCCATSYAGAGRGAQGARCFAKGCQSSACPRAMLPTPACDAGAAERRRAARRRLFFKYADEGRSAIVHAVALAQPGASLARAPDRWPTRLEIRLPPSVGSRFRPTAAVRPAESTYVYFCKTCETADVVDRISINVTGCLFARETRYGRPEYMDATRGGHTCRYYEEYALAQVCDSIDDRREFGWWCNDARRLLD